jgi:hypothetical protein
MARNLVAQHRVTTAQADRLATEMRRAFPDAAIEGWEGLEEEMLNDPKDRHVAAAAKYIEAGVIVTANLKDFGRLPADVRAISPDAFLTECLAAEPAKVLAALRKQAAGYRHPPADLDTLLAWLEGDLPGFVPAVRRAIISAEKA